jgi:hypothetical protein
LGICALGLDHEDSRRRKDYDFGRSNDAQSLLKGAVYMDVKTAVYMEYKNEFVFYTSL